MIEYKYKIGQAVKVIPDLKLMFATPGVSGALYGMISGPSAGTHRFAVKPMDKWAGKVVHIDRYFDHVYIVKELTDVVWTDEMFEGPAEEDEIFCDTLL